MQGAKKRLDFPENTRPTTAPGAGGLQQDQADSDCSDSVVSRVTGRGQQLYERGMEMKLRQEQIRQQLIQVGFTLSTLIFYNPRAHVTKHVELSKAQPSLTEKSAFELPKVSYQTTCQKRQWVANIGLVRGK